MIPSLKYIMERSDRCDFMSSCAEHRKLKNFLTEFIMEVTKS